MKLKLRSENDIQILTIAEIDSSKNVDVLRAGITQILRNGKNRIILELAQARSIPPELLRELGRLKLLANELAGDILLTGLDTESKQKVDSFSQPPFTVSFHTTAEALAHFKQRPSVPKKSDLPPSPGPSLQAQAQATPQSATALTPIATAIDPTTAINVQFKEELRQRELGEVGTLRKQIESLKSENQSLMELLAKKVLERQDPPDAAAYRTKITELETQLAALLSPAPEKKA
jgi:hypothetical protein